MRTGRCYCGASVIEISAAPETVCYCHCVDCRRITGAPVAGFACFASEAVQVRPDPGTRSAFEGVRRRACPDCGSPLTAEFDYLPGQIYVPIGVIEDATDLVPEMHAHANRCLPWLKIEDDLPRQEGTARDALNAACRA